ncbi:dihydrodipicolinate synthase family protein [Eubacteriales bacterium OttesenSCG-928-A19]|nr:dihydrodipicolinate synthase family protein [Eubacteriales bacterium OttesenSCG-928-A19]
MKHFDMKDIKGVIPAMLTPFEENERVSPERTQGLVRHLMRNDIGGLYLTGSTGEGFMMSIEERKAVVEAAVAEVAGRIPVIVHVGAISTCQSEELARHAMHVGADAISSVPPIYWRFTDDNIAGYYADLVQASGLPMIVYNVALAGNVSFDLILRLGRLEGVEGIKYTATSHYDMFRIKEQLGEGFMVYSGSDEMAASGMMFGSDGLIGSTYNVLSDIFISIFRAARAGEMQELARLQEAANRIIFTMLRYDLMSVLKLSLRWMGVDVGPTRRPFTQYSVEDERSIREAFLPLKQELARYHVAFLESL